MDGERENTRPRRGATVDSAGGRFRVQTRTTDVLDCVTSLEHDAPEREVTEGGAGGEKRAPDGGDGTCPVANSVSDAGRSGVQGRKG